MAAKRITYYFAYNSPYSFLANTRIVKELAAVGGEARYRPLYSPRTSGGGPDIGSPKMQYLFEDVRRFADAYRLELNPGPFADTRKACLGFLYAEDKGKGRAYHDSIYAARWLEGKDLGAEDVLFGIAETCGLDVMDFRVALTESRYQAALDQSNKEGQEDGVFGVPTFIYDGQKFWGNDRIEWVVRAIRNDSAT